MNLKRRTPFTDMIRTAIIGKLAELDREALAEELGVTLEAINTELSRFSYISARVDFKKDEVDFDLALPKDTTKQLRSKFLKYLYTEYMALVIQARDGLGEMDAPFYEAYAPEPPDDPN